MVIGPQLLGLVSDTAGVATISEFGVVLMLFVIGLELSPQRLWVMRRSVFGTGAAAGAGQLRWRSAAVGLFPVRPHRQGGDHRRRQPGVVVDRVRPADPGRAQGSRFGLRAAGVLDPAVPGSGGDSADCDGAAAGASSATHGLDLCGIAAHGGRDRGGDGGRPLPVAPGVPFRGQGRCGGGVHRHRAAGGDGHGLADGAGRGLVHAGRVPRRRAAGRFGIPARAGIAHRAVQGPAAGPVLHQRRHVDGPDPAAAPAAAGAGLVAGVAAAEGRFAVAAGPPAGRARRRDALRLAVLLASGGEFAFVVLKQAAEQQLIGGTPARRAGAGDHLVDGLDAAAGGAGGSGCWMCEAKKPEREYDTIDADPPRVIIAGFGRVGQIVGRMLRAQRHSVRGAGALGASRSTCSRRFGTSTVLRRSGPTGTAARGAGGQGRGVRAGHRRSGGQPAHRAAGTPAVPAPEDHGARAQPPARVPADGSGHRRADARDALLQPEDDPQARWRHWACRRSMAADQVERFRRHDEELLKKQYLVYDDETRLMQTTSEALGDLQQSVRGRLEPESRRRAGARKSIARPE